MVSGRTARRATVALQRRAFRHGGAKFQLLRHPAGQDVRSLGRGDARWVPVRREVPPAALAPRHEGGRPTADLRQEAEVTDRGNVILTPELEHKVTVRFLDELKPLEQVGKLGALLLQMTLKVRATHGGPDRTRTAAPSAKGQGRKPTAGRARTPARRLARRPTP